MLCKNLTSSVSAGKPSSPRFKNIQRVVLAAVDVIHLAVTKHEQADIFLRGPAMAEAFCALIQDLRSHQAHQLTAVATVTHLCSQEQGAWQAKLQPYTDTVERYGVDSLILAPLQGAT